MNQDITRYFSKRKRISNEENGGEASTQSITSTSEPVPQGVASRIGEVMDTTGPPEISPDGE